VIGSQLPGGLPQQPWSELVHVAQLLLKQQGNALPTKQTPALYVLPAASVSHFALHPWQETSL